jgi:hypothetical protein
VLNEERRRERMQNKRGKILSTLIATLLILSAVAVFPTLPVNAVPTTTIEVINPLTGNSTFSFISYGDGGVGKTFDAQVWIKNVTLLKAFQICLEFNNVQLNILNVDRDVTVADHVFNGRTTIDAPVSFDYPTINTDGRVLFGSAIMAGTPVNGSGRAGTITFEIMQNVTEAAPLISSTLFLRETAPYRTYLEDPDGEEMSFDPVHGDFSLQWTEIPLPIPWLEVSPPIQLGVPMGPSIIGTDNAFFTVDIVIKNVAPERKLIGIQSVVLSWPQDLVRLVSSWEGPFLASFAPYGTLFGNETDPPMPNATQLTLFVVMWPNATTGNYDWNTWPEGEGVVATVMFEAIKQDEYPWTGAGSFNLEPLFGNYFLDAKEEWIPYEPAEDGTYDITGWIAGRMIDLYTCDYPYPYGGQGLNQTADMYQPQKTVHLQANVTYNMDPVQYKLVTFEIRGPINAVFNHTLIRTAFTDENGVASIEFGLPWPCEDPETEIFGIWTVVAGVDIRCTVVKDWLWFKVWWEVEITSVVPKLTSYTKGDIAEFEVSFRTFREQPHWALIYIVVYDDLDVPIGKDCVWVYVGWGNHTYCRFWEDNVTLQIFIPKWAFVGVGKVYANVLSKHPFCCGYAYGPEASDTFDILKYT